MTHSTEKVRLSHARIADVGKPDSLDHTAIVWAELIGEHQVTRVHASGRFDAPVADVVDYHRALITKYRPTVLTATEAQEKGIVKALRKRLGRRYGVRKAGEYLCIVDRAEARHRLWPAKRVRMTRIPGLVDWRNLFIGDFRVRLIGTRIRYVVTVGHVASGVQHGDRYRTDRPAIVAANRDGLIAWGHYLDRLSGRVCSASMDSNLDQHREAWRAHVGGALGGPTTWDHSRPAGGTHAGNRLIDTAVVRVGGSRFRPAAPSEGSES